MKRSRKILLIVALLVAVGIVVYSKCSYITKRRLQALIGWREIKEPLSSRLFPVQPEAEGDYYYGYMDETGELVILPQFVEAQPFSEGLGCVGVNSKKGGRLYGFIDSSGEFVIPPQFTSAFPFHEGYARVNTGRRGYHGCFIDKKGKVLLEGNFDADSTSDISNGRFAECVRGPMEKYDPNLIDDLLTVFTVGLARPPDSTYGVKRSIVRKDGKILVREDSLRFRWDKDGRLFDADPNELDSLKNRIAFELHAGRIPLTDRGMRLQGYIYAPWPTWLNRGTRMQRIDPASFEKQWTLVIPPQYHRAGDFVNGIAEVELKSEKIFIDTLGNVICRFRK
jgi:hypothetical protein